MSWLKDEIERSADTAAAQRLEHELLRKGVAYGRGHVMISVPMTEEGVMRGVAHLLKIREEMWPQPPKAL